MAKAAPVVLVDMLYIHINVCYPDTEGNLWCCQPAHSFLQAGASFSGQYMFGTLLMCTTHLTFQARCLFSGALLQVENTSVGHMLDFSGYLELCEL